MATSTKLSHKITRLDYIGQRAISLCMSRPNLSKLDEVSNFIQGHPGVTEKKEMRDLVVKNFNLTNDRRTWFCDDFAIKFCGSRNCGKSNTIVGLKRIQKYDHIPFLACMVTVGENSLKLINSTFIKKASSTSKNLTETNIVGSVNGWDIYRGHMGVMNTPENFRELFSVHKKSSFDDNIGRIVKGTCDIRAIKKPFKPSLKQEGLILRAVARTKRFFESDDYRELMRDLNERTLNVQTELCLAAGLESRRGQVVECLICGSEEDKSAVSTALRSGTDIPSFKQTNGLGDHHFKGGKFTVETDVKSKVLGGKSNAKGYSVDKALRYLSNNHSVLMFYFVGIDTKNGTVKTSLVSPFQQDLFSAAAPNLHWTGKDDLRGIATFNGDVMEQLIKKPDQRINDDDVNAWLKKQIVALKPEEATEGEIVIGELAGGFSGKRENEKSSNKLQTSPR